MLDVASLPKAEFHLHFEATLGWKEYVPISGLPELAGMERAPWLASPNPFPTFEHFLAPWRSTIIRTLKSPGIYERWADACARWLAGLGVRYAEVSVGMNLIEKLGHRPEETVPALCRALDTAEKAHGLAFRLIGALKRDCPPVDNAKWVERWIAIAGARLAGIDLHGYEIEGPTAPQKPAFDLARKAGLRLRAHAGEHGTWRDVRDAVEVLGVSSINHGVRAADDEGLMRELAARRVVLHVCPTSNVMLGTVASYSEHPVRRFMEAGIPVTINSDDPLVFGTDINAEFAHLQREAGFDDSEVRLLLRNAWDCALVPAQVRRARLECLQP